MNGGDPATIYAAYFLPKGKRTWQLALVTEDYMAALRSTPRYSACRESAILRYFPEHAEDLPATVTQAAWEGHLALSHQLRAERYLEEAAELVAELEVGGRIKVGQHDGLLFALQATWAANRHEDAATGTGTTFSIGQSTPPWFEFFTMKRY